MERLSLEDSRRPSTLQQVWPVIIRLLRVIARKWISSIIGYVVAPILVVGLYIHLLDYTSKSKKDNTLLIEITESLISMVMYMATVLMATNFAQLLIIDKQTSFKSLIVSMGLRKQSYYLGTFAVFLAIILIPTLVSCTATLIYLFQDLIVSRIWIALIFLLFSVHFIAYIFALCSLITSTSFIILFYLPLVADLSLHLLVKWITQKHAQDPSVNWWVVFLASASPYECLRILSDSYNSCLNRKGCDDNPLAGFAIQQPLYSIVLAMCFWITMGFAFGLWFEEICPWKKDSEIKPLLFCLKRKPKFSKDQQSRSSISNSKFFEQRSVDLTNIGIAINAVTKVYKSIPVVNNLTFNIFQGETTLLLGHNGAGKTTLMNMILGKLSPDSGKVFIRKSMSQYVESGTQDYGIGVCPQSSILDDNLTVTEHLELLYDIKTFSNSRTRREAIQETIADLRLEAHSDCYPSQISGGMKRKLSLGMALVGKSDILILDEPSSGLDPDSRVWVWSIIKRYRGTRTVLLSTQHMEEADYLGDRIAIMSKGNIICCGSSIFLNSTFNSGYKLRVDCLGSKKKEVLEFVQSYFSSAKLSNPEQLNSLQNQKDQIQDMVIELCDDQKDSEKKLIAMLECIENNSQALHICSHGLRSSSIEDVMLKTNDFEIENSQSGTSIGVDFNNVSINKLVNTPVGEKGGDCSMIIALLTKFLHIYKRTWKTILFNRILVPALMIWFSVLTSKSESTFRPGIKHSVYIIHYIALPVAERVTGFKTVQLSSGATRTNYWISFLLVDLISAAINVFFINLFYVTTYTGEYYVSRFTIHSLLSLSMLMFNMATMLFAYVTSFLFKDSKNSTGYFFILQLVPSFVGMLITILAITLNSNWRQNFDSDADLAFMVVYPSLAFEYILFGFGVDCLYGRGPNCSNSETDVSPITIGLTILSLQIAAYGILLAYFEYARLNLSNWSLSALYCKYVKPKQSQLRPIDEDVTQESRKTKQIINNVPKDDYILVAHDLVKSYVEGVKVIDHLSFSVKRRECFGLLGINGAGKSTTFSMIVSDFKQDAGLIWLNGHYSSDNIDIYRRSLGYDPQIEPDFALSPMEALTLMAKLRMVRESYIPELVKSIIDLLEMCEHSQKSTGDLSGGTKRKLALGMSLIGNPKLLALDEPTAGVDPMARRNIWNLLRSLRNHNDSSVLISSHAMEECEAICDRIAIMARGRLRCIGSFLNLRTKFVRGCRVKIEFNHNPESTTGTMSIDVMASDIATQLQSAISCEVKVSDTNMNSATLSIVSNDFRRSKILCALREAKKKFRGISYVINDPSLEDIFITIAQEEDNKLISETSVAHV